MQNTEGFELDIPENTSGSKTTVFGSDFAGSIGVSPDNKTVALAYGYRQNNDGYEVIGLYDLGDGRRMATLAEDVHKTGILHGALMSDDFVARYAPSRGPILFSPDSLILYADSNHVRQWDLSQMH